MEMNAKPHRKRVRQEDVPGETVIPLSDSDSSTGRVPLSDSDSVTAGNIMLRHNGWQRILLQHQRWQRKLMQALGSASESTYRVVSPLLGLGVFDTLIIVYYMPSGFMLTFDAPVGELLAKYQHRAAECVWSQPELKAALLMDVGQNTTINMVRQLLGSADHEGGFRDGEALASVSDEVHAQANAGAHA